MKNHHHLGRMHMALAALLVTLVAACGGGSVLPNIERIVVVGDSLSDVGTFNGMKFTVQNAADESAGYPIWTQLTETAYGLDGNAQCNHYVATSVVPTFSALTDAASCTNYAIGGAQIYAPSPLADEFNIGTQLEKHVSASGFNANDLLLIDGGGNDLAKLAELYLADLNLDSTETGAFDFYVLAFVTDPDRDRAVAGGQYMAALASEYYDIISGVALQNGAQQVLVVNVPDITLTPRFLAALAGIEQSSGAAVAIATKGVIRGWAQAFNGALKDLAANESRVVIADFFTQFDSQIANFEAYGLTNVVDAACPAVPGSLLGDLPACFDATLDLDTSNGRKAGWWTTYAFSDNFHPTPKGHELLAEYVKQTLKGAGWL